MMMLLYHVSAATFGSFSASRRISTIREYNPLSSFSHLLPLGNTAFRNLLTQDINGGCIYLQHRDSPAPSTSLSRRFTRTTRAAYICSYRGARRWMVSYSCPRYVGGDAVGNTIPDDMAATEERLESLFNETVREALGWLDGEKGH